MSATMSWKDLPKQVLLDATEFCDGHSIVGVEAFLQLGVPADLVARYDLAHGGEGLEDANGDAVNEVRGVYCLNILEALSHDLGLAGSCYHGREMQARQLKSQITQHLEAMS